MCKTYVHELLNIEKMLSIYNNNGIAKSINTTPVVILY